MRNAVITLGLLIAASGAAFAENEKTRNYVTLLAPNDEAYTTFVSAGRTVRNHLTKGSPTQNLNLVLPETTSEMDVYIPHLNLSRTIKVKPDAGSHFYLSIRNSGLSVEQRDGP